MPREWYSPTQPFPTKPPAFDRQGFLESDVLDLTPELKAEALKVVSQYKIGPIYTPPIVAGQDGKAGTALRTERRQLARAARSIPTTGMLYVYSHTLLRVLSMVNDPKRSDMNYISAGGAATMAEADSSVQGLPLVKPPWGRITAIDLNKGEIVWQIAHGDTPDAVKNHPALKGVDHPADRTPRRRRRQLRRHRHARDAARW